MTYIVVRKNYSSKMSKVYLMRTFERLTLFFIGLKKSLRRSKARIKYTFEILEEEFFRTTICISKKKRNDVYREINYVMFT